MAGQNRSNFNSDFVGDRSTALVFYRIRSINNNLKILCTKFINLKTIKDTLLSLIYI